MDFTWYWISMGVAVILVTALLTLGSKWPWHFSFDGSTLMVCTPWWGIKIADREFDERLSVFWSGVVIFKRVKGTEHLDRFTGRQIFEDWYRYDVSSSCQFYGEY